jgi:metal-responsive CopG/Arc/MetJ family transcriptional regulator
MHTDTVRLNISLPKDLARALDKLTGPRKRSRFISEAISQRVQQLQREEIERILEQGYRADRQESLDLAKEFEAVDLEGWDEY